MRSTGTQQGGTTPYSYNSNLKGTQTSLRSPELLLLPRRKIYDVNAVFSGAVGFPLSSPQQQSSEEEDGGSRAQQGSDGGHGLCILDDTSSTEIARRTWMQSRRRRKLCSSFFCFLVAFLRMLMWEDGYCRPAGCCSENGQPPAGGSAAENSEALAGIHRVHSSFNLGDDVEEEDPVRKAFRKMSIQLYNYGEGLMGKVASDKCHKWVFRESSETEVGPLNYWQSSFDSHPPEWMDQFSAGIQTIAVIQAGHGLLQLGSCKIVAEDLHFVLRMRYTFESLENQAGGGFLSQTFAPMRNRFFCGSPTGGGATPQAALAASAAAWQNGHASAAAPTYFQTSSDFRLRLGVSTESHPAAGNDDHNITSLRLSLQNGSPGAVGDRSLNFDFRNGDHESQVFAGIKRHAEFSSPGPTEVGGSRSNLLARRMQCNSKIDPEGGGHSSSFQDLLQGGNGNKYSSSAPQSGVFLNNNNGVRSHHDGGLMVQIPPVIGGSSPMVSPMMSPGGSHKVQRTGNCMSPIIQAALHEALERTSRSGGNNASPLAARLSKLTEHSPHQQYVNGNTTSKRLSLEPPPPAAAATPPHFPGSHPSTPSSHKDSYLVVDHTSSATLVDSSNGGGGSEAASHIKRGDPLQLPAAAWENLKESLEVPRRQPPSSSGDLYPDFMDSFFE